MIDVLDLKDLETKPIEILIGARGSRERRRALAAEFLLGGSHRKEYIERALRAWAEVSRKTLTSGLPAFMLDQTPLNEGVKLSSRCIEII